VRESSLASSITRETPSAGYVLGEPGECERRSDRVFRCSVADSSGSGGVVYEVTVRGGSCWRARLVDASGGEGGLPHRAEGCVRLLPDHLGLTVGRML
jgi:hypothetical protein